MELANCTFVADFKTLSKTIIFLSMRTKVEFDEQCDLASTCEYLKDALRASRDDLENAIEMAQMREQMDRAAKALLDEVTGLMNENEELKDENERLAQTQEQHDSEVEQLNDQILTLTKEKKALKRENKALKVDLESKEMKLEELKEEPEKGGDGSAADAFFDIIRGYLPSAQRKSVKIRGHNKMVLQNLIQASGFPIPKDIEEALKKLDDDSPTVKVEGDMKVMGDYVEKKIVNNNE